MDEDDIDRIQEIIQLPAESIKHPASFFDYGNIHELMHDLKYLKFYH